MCFNYFQIQIISKIKYVKFKNEYISLIFSIFFFLLFLILYFIEINYINQINIRQKYRKSNLFNKILIIH